MLPNLSLETCNIILIIATPTLSNGVSSRNSDNSYRPRVINRSKPTKEGATHFLFHCSYVIYCPSNRTTIHWPSPWHPIAIRGRADCRRAGRLGGSEGCPQHLCRTHQPRPGRAPAGRLVRPQADADRIAARPDRGSDHYGRGLSAHLPRRRPDGTAS